MGMCGGGASGSTTTVQKSDPWSGIQPYLTGTSTRQLRPGVQPTYAKPNALSYDEWAAKNPGGNDALPSPTQDGYNQYLASLGNGPQNNPDSDYETSVTPGVYPEASRLYQQGQWSKDQAGLASNMFRTLQDRQYQYGNYDRLAADLINGKYDYQPQTVSYLNPGARVGHTNLEASTINGLPQIAANRLRSEQADARGYDANLANANTYQSRDAQARGYGASQADARGYDAAQSDYQGYNASLAKGQGYRSQGYDAAVSGAQGYNTRDAQGQGYNAATAQGQGYNAAQTRGTNGVTGSQAFGNLGQADPSGALSRILSGEVDTATLDPVIKNASRRMAENFNEQVMPGINTAAQGAGQYGGSRQGIAQGLAAKGLANAQSDMAASLYSQAYQQAQSNRANAANALSSLGFSVAGQNADRDLQNQQYNAGALNQAGQYNANVQNAASMANAGFQNTASQFAAAANNAANLNNANASNQAGQFGAAAQNQSSLANQAALNASRQFGAGAQNAASQFGASSRNAASLANAAAQNQAGQFNAQAFNANSGQNAAMRNAASQFGAQGYNAAALANAGYLNQAGQFDAQAYNANQRSNADAANQAAAFNAGAGNTIGLANSNALNAAGQFGANAYNTNQQYNANLRTQNNQYNANQDYQAQQQNIANWLAMNQYNANAQNAMGQYNASQNMQSQLANLGNDQRVNEFNANLQLKNNDLLSNALAAQVGNRTLGMNTLTSGNALIDNIYGLQQNLLNAGNDYNWSNLSSLASIINNGARMGGSSSTSSPYFSNTAGNLIGGAATGISLADKMGLFRDSGSVASSAGDLSSLASYGGDMTSAADSAMIAADINSAGLGGFADGGMVRKPPLRLAQGGYTEGYGETSASDPDGFGRYGGDYRGIIGKGVLSYFGYGAASPLVHHVAEPMTRGMVSTGDKAGGVTGAILMDPVGASASGKYKPEDIAAGNATIALGVPWAGKFLADGGAVKRKGFDDGGRVSGPGTETSDSIPAWLSDGEYVLNADAVKMVGKGLLDKVNDAGKAVRRGLLDMTPEQGDSLMNFGTGMLAASGPSRMPVGFGQALASGVQHMQAGQRQRLDDEVTRQGMMMRKMQMDEQMRRNQAQQAFRSQLPEQYRGMFDVAPDRVIGQMFKEPEKPQLVEVADPSNPNRTVKRWVRPGESSGTDIGFVREKAPEGMRYDDGGNLVPIGGYLDMKKQIAAAGRAPAQPTPAQIVQTDQGMMLFDPRARSMSPATLPDGTPLKPKLRDVPGTASTAIMENRKALAAIDDAIAAINKYPDAMGGMNYLGDAVRQRTDPDGVEARGKVAQVGGIRLHDLSGAAVTATELSRLQPYIPVATDSPEAARKKLQTLRQEYANTLSQQESAFGPEQGYRAFPGMTTGAPAKQVVKRGRYDGRTVVQYSDGSVEYAD